MPNDQIISPDKSLLFRHFPQLDGLRGVAILLVVVGHVAEFNFGMAMGGPLAGLGVMLFFVLSGFLITGLLGQEVLETGQLSLLTFYTRRALRLFPALYFYLAVVSLLIKFRTVRDTPWYAVIACVLYLRNIRGRGTSTSHIWSLSIEEQFYLFWPWVINMLNRNASLWVAWAGVAIVSTFRMTAIHLQLFDYNSGIFYTRTWFRIDSILIGCAMALWLCQSQNLGKVRSRLAGFSLSVLLWPVVLTWTCWGEAITHVWYLTVQMLLATLILVNLLLCKKSSYISAFSHPLLTWFGRISYSWYLWQQLFTVLHTPAWFGSLTVPINIATSLLIAAVSYKLVERPFLRLKDRLNKSKPATNSVSVAC